MADETVKTKITQFKTEDLFPNMGLMKGFIEQEIDKMKALVEDHCSQILIKKGIAREEMTPYEWGRLARLLENRSDGKTYYWGSMQCLPVYEVIYFEPAFPGWAEPEKSYKVNLGSFQVKEL